MSINEMYASPKFNLAELQRQGIAVINSHHPHSKFPVSEVGRVELQSDEMGNPHVFHHHAFTHTFKPQFAVDDWQFPFDEISNMMDLVKKNIVTGDEKYLQEAKKHIPCIENMDFNAKMQENVNKDVISQAHSIYEHSLFELGIIEKAVTREGFRQSDLRLLNPSNGTVKRYFDRHRTERVHPDITLTTPPGDYTMSAYVKRIEQLVAELGYRGCVFVEKEEGLSKDYYYYSGLNTEIVDKYNLNYLSLEINPYNIQSKGLTIPSMQMYNWGYIVTYLRDGYIQTQRYAHNPKANRYLPDTVDQQLKFSHFFHDRFFNGIMNIVSTTNLFLDHYRNDFEASTSDIVDISVAQVFNITEGKHEVRGQVRTVMFGEQKVSGRLKKVVVDISTAESYPNRLSDMAFIAMSYEDVGIVEFTKVLTTSPSEYNMIYNPACTGLIYYAADIVEHVYRVFDCKESDLFVYERCSVCGKDYPEKTTCCRLKTDQKASHYVKGAKHPIVRTNISDKKRKAILKDGVTCMYRALVPKIYPSGDPPEYFLKMDGTYLPRRPGEYLCVKGTLVGQMLDRNYHSRVDGLTTFCIRSNHSFPDSFVGLNPDGDPVAVARMPSHRLAFGMTLLDVARCSTGKVGYLWQNTLGTKIFNFSTADPSNSGDNAIPEMEDLNIENQAINIPGLSKVLKNIFDKEELDS